MDRDFEENGDIVINDVPDEVVAEIDRRAAGRGWSVDEELRSILVKTYGSDSGRAPR